VQRPPRLNFDAVTREMVSPGPSFCLCHVLSPCSH
jgi:hypothetical protein